MHITKKGGPPKGAPVVFMQHGLFASAEFWAIRGKDAPAFQIIDAGFDVWLGNSRGNMYSRKNDHISPSKDAKDFFDFSFYEMGKNDAPAQIDFVR